ncbi:MAG: hypothetical protein ACKN81_18570, partial [Pirellulaceae bacterium]
SRDRRPIPRLLGSLPAWSPTAAFRSSTNSRVYTVWMVLEWMVLWRGQGALDRNIRHLHPGSVSLADPF